MHSGFFAVCCLNLGSFNRAAGVSGGPGGPLGQAYAFYLIGPRLRYCDLDHSTLSK